LKEFAKLRGILQESHVRIPELLQTELDLGRALGKAEVEGTDSTALRKQLDETRSARDLAQTRRRAACDALVEFEQPLRSERTRIERLRSERVQAVTKDFEARFRTAYEQFQLLWSEGEALKAMGASPFMPFPGHVKFSYDGSSHVEVVKGDVKPSLDPEIERLTQQIERIDANLTVVGGVQQARAIDERSYYIDRQRRAPAPQYDLFRVTRRLHCLIDNSWFEVGTLVNAALLGSGNLKRMESYLRPAELESHAGVAA
jgi:hypothetical protein